MPTPNFPPSLSVKRPGCPHCAQYYPQPMVTAINDSMASNNTNVELGFFCRSCSTFFLYTPDVFDATGGFWLLCRAVEGGDVIRLAGESIKIEFFDKNLQAEIS